MEHAVFSKRRGLKTTDMTPSSWVYDQFKRLHAGVEGRHLFPQALPWTGALPLARPASLPGMGTFGGLHAQPGATAPHLIGVKRRKTHKTGTGNTARGLAVDVIPVPPNPVLQIRKNGVTSSRINQNMGQTVLPGSAPSADGSKAGGELRRLRTETK